MAEKRVLADVIDLADSDTDADTRKQRKRRGPPATPDADGIETDPETETDSDDSGLFPLRPATARDSRSKLKAGHIPVDGKKPGGKPAPMAGAGGPSSPRQMHIKVSVDQMPIVTFSEEISALKAGEWILVKNARVREMLKETKPSGIETEDFDVVMPSPTLVFDADAERTLKRIEFQTIVVKTPLKPELSRKLWRATFTLLKENSDCDDNAIIKLSPEFANAYMKVDVADLKERYSNMADDLDVEYGGSYFHDLTKLPFTVTIARKTDDGFAANPAATAGSGEYHASPGPGSDVRNAAWPAAGATPHSTPVTDAGVDIDEIILNYLVPENPVKGSIVIAPCQEELLARVTERLENAYHKQNGLIHDDEIEITLKGVTVHPTPVSSGKVYYEFGITGKTKVEVSLGAQKIRTALAKNLMLKIAENSPNNRLQGSDLERLFNLDIDDDGLITEADELEEFYVETFGTSAEIKPFVHDITLTAVRLTCD